ncbi:hypothetical protein BP5796_09973 [Coleophoma crateriformis]|uniref:Uncharacterized protein n=1 Tax=Coleophoma crateriformis TaxID=565419 RepID=A0A3D8QUB8_9HELO|nr:hypothetical protein BP5796_09973 [Coleophoma crateriformis]
MPSFFSKALLSIFLVQSTVSAQLEPGYIGYSLKSRGDPDSTVFDTSSTPANVSSLTIPEPDVFLNATVHVGELDILVANLTAKISLDAKVLNLLTFNAGVDVSIDRVRLLLQKVDAQVILEARLSNLVLMIDDVLNSLDLNPILATLGQDLTSVVNTTVGALTTGSPVAKRGLDYSLANNILYSVNDYSGRTHTNRVLTQSGSIVDESLDNDGNSLGSRTVGSYTSDMTFNGFNKTVVLRGQSVNELEYVYSPFTGLSVVSAIYINGTGGVVATQVLSESGGGGSSTIG